MGYSQLLVFLEVRSIGKIMVGVGRFFMNLGGDIVARWRKDCYKIVLQEHQEKVGRIQILFLSWTGCACKLNSSVDENFPFVIYKSLMESFHLSSRNFPFVIYKILRFILMLQSFSCNSLSFGRTLMMLVVITNETSITTKLLRSSLLRLWLHRKNARIRVILLVPGEHETFRPSRPIPMFAISDLNKKILNKNIISLFSCGLK